MLNDSNLSQLKQLKQQIEQQKEYADGVVKGTQRKFGFVVLDDGREIFLDPEEMQKVFPGDRVRILIIHQPNEEKKGKNSKIKLSGTLEKLIDSPLNTFAGRYVVKGKGHFVEPDLPRLNRWIFIPPAARKNAKDGDYIHCKISRHAYPHGKPQAKILTVIGAENKLGIEADYMINKFQLAPDWPQDWQQSLKTIDSAQRQDLTDIDFITIDAASTQDMDDALFAKTTDSGWQLQIAISDPNALIEENSALDKIARQRGTSTYIPGQAVPMLPEELSTNLCSLTAGQTRPALVCSVNINTDGGIEDYQIIEAMVSSKAKLSYRDVAQYLDPQADTNDELSDCNQHRATLTTLQNLAAALHQRRKKENLIIPSRQEFRLLLNAQRKLDKIIIDDKNKAHQLVEECMVAANCCAAKMLGDNGIFISHPGFRSERIADVKKLAEEQLSLTDVDFSTPEGYRQLMNSIVDEELTFPLRAVLSRLLERSRLSATPAPHYGMGLAAYTTITSPIRKYSDLLVHRLIKQKIRQQAVKPLQEQDLLALQATLDNSRQARNQMEQWLKCQFIQPMLGQSFSGVVSQINSNGFTVRLDDNYIEGFVETRLLKEKYSFDPMRLRLSSKSQCIELEQAINVVVSEVNCDQRSIRFALAASAEKAEQPTTEAAT